MKRVSWLGIGIGLCGVALGIMLLCSGCSTVQSVATAELPALTGTGFQGATIDADHGATVLWFTNGVLPQIAGIALRWTNLASGVNGINILGTTVGMDATGVTIQPKAITIPWSVLLTH